MEIKKIDSIDCNQDVSLLASHILVACVISELCFQGQKNRHKNNGPSAYSLLYMQIEVIPYLRSLVRLQSWIEIRNQHTLLLP